MPVNSDIDIVNRALSRIGALPISSLETPGAAGRIPANVYNSVRDDILSKYPWQFTLRFAELSRKGAAANQWTGEFHLPPDRLALPRAYYETAADERPVKRFQLFQTTVCTLTDTLFADYQVLPEAAHMPPYFVELLVLATAAELALSIREDRTLRDKLRTDAYGSELYQGEGGQFAVAATLDAQSGASPQIDAGHDPVSDARYTLSDRGEEWSGW